MMRALFVALVLASCGTTTAPSDAGGDASGPRTIVLTSDTVPTAGPGVRLSDGATLGAGEGDVWLTETMVVMIHANAPATICSLGTFASLADAPSACASAMGASVTLGGSTQGMDQWVGQSFLVAAGTQTYRARIEADSLATTHVRITLEIAP